MGLLCSPTVGSKLASIETTILVDMGTTEATQLSGHNDEGHTEM